MSAELLRRIFTGVAISFSWLFLHPLARDEVNLNVVALTLVLSLATSISAVTTLMTINRTLGLILVSLAALAVLSTVVSGGRVGGLRDVALIVMTVALGLSLSISADRRTILLGSYRRSASRCRCWLGAVHSKKRFVDRF